MAFKKSLINSPLMGEGPKRIKKNGNRG